MRTIERSTTFKRDYKRESKGQHRATLDADLRPILIALATDTQLEPRYRDHDLSGEWAGYRDCHVKPDESGGAKLVHGSGGIVPLRAA